MEYHEMLVQAIIPEVRESNIVAARRWEEPHP